MQCIGRSPDVKENKSHKNKIIINVDLDLPHFFFKSRSIAGRQIASQNFALEVFPIREGTPLAMI